MNTAYIFIADGFEDIEALATRDALVRAGIQVQLVSITDDPFVVSSHGLPLGADNFIDAIEPDESDALICPGGMPGSKNLAACKPLIRMLIHHHQQAGTIAAICAAPALVLSQLPDIRDMEMTCFDGFEQSLEDKGVRFVRRPAVTCANIITGRSAGYSVLFGIEIIKRLKGEEAAAKVAAGMLLPVD